MKLPQPPAVDNERINDWLFLLWKLLQNFTGGTGGTATVPTQYQAIFLPDSDSTGGDEGLAMPGPMGPQGPQGTPGVGGGGAGGTCWLVDEVYEESQAIPALPPSAWVLAFAAAHG
jgi:hypothetical protein